ncbi:MAG: hypothetical protein ACKOFO_12165 [Gemmatimonadota bacterium]
MTKVLHGLGGVVTPFIPDRIADGYDLGPAGVAAAQRIGGKVVVTCDHATEPAQDLGHHRRRADAVHVVVAMHEDRFATLHRAREAVRGVREIDHRLRGFHLRERRSQKALRHVDGVDPTRREELTDGEGDRLFPRLVPRWGERSSERLGDRRRCRRRWKPAGGRPTPTHTA